LTVRILSVALLLALGVGFSGCGDPLVRVEGWVTLDGSPLPGCNLIFVPTNMEGQTVSGRTDSQGHFELTGLVPAEYAVLANLLPENHAGDVGLQAESTRGRKTETLPADYGLVAKTPLRVEIPTAEPIRLEIRGGNR